MTVRVPEIMRQSWGDELLGEFVPWLEQVVEEKTIPRLEQIVAEKAVPRDGYRQVLSRLDVLEHDMADLKTDVRDLRSEMNRRFVDLERHVEMRFDQVNDRFDQMARHIEGRFDQMNERFDTRLDQMNERMLVQTRWLLGSIALFGTIITILLAIAQFTP
jgi:Mg2+ and Co2+ transporter CorA